MSNESHIDTSDDIARLRARALEWLAHDPDPETRALTEALLARDDADAHAELRACFGARLAFGTAGIRGLLGPGPGRMNRALVRRVTAGVAQYLTANVPDARRRGVVIGHDARRGSVEFAADASRVMAGAGIRVYRCRPLSPTPLVAFAALELGCACAIVVTASHNPPAYNGYKVYWANGAQIIPPVDVGIAAAIDAVAGVQVADDGIEDAPPELEARYLAAISDQVAHVPTGEGRITVVYTPLHGVGARLCEAALGAQGVDVMTVPEQRAPDGAFPTVVFPNPEEAGALDLADALADATGDPNATAVDLILANDPDADRLSVTVRVDGALRRLSGDELGAVLGDALLEARGADANRADRAFVGRSIVSSELLGQIAAYHGAACVETLTGFKWLWNVALEREAAGGRFVFAYEEAIGYSVGPAVRDKDGIGAAALVARLASGERTLWDRLQAIWERHGYYATRQRSIVDSSPDGVRRHAERMKQLRAHPPTTVAGQAVHRRRDLADGIDGLPPADCLAWWLSDGTRIMIRPSGTEPKLKIYLQVIRPWAPGAEASAAARLDELGDALSALVMSAA